jgi:hypothetical protein
VFYLIHQAGKVASQTLESTILMSDPGSKVERHHYLEAGNLAEVERLCDLAEPSAQVEALRFQTSRAHLALQRLAMQKPRDVWVLSGFRDPLDLAISAFFQNLSYYVPHYSSPAPGEAYDRRRFDAEVDRVIDVFTNEVTSYLERARLGTGARDVRELDLRRKLQNLGEWFEREFNPVHGVDVYELDVGGKPLVHFTRGEKNFVLYRMETLQASLGKLLRLLPIAAVRGVVVLNTAAQKDYSVLYDRFRERFIPTGEMMEYYYGGRFFAHFYPGARPLYGTRRVRARSV